MSEGIEKLNDVKRRLQGAKDDHHRLKGEHDRVHSEWEELMAKKRTKDLMKNIDSNLDGEVDTLNQNHFNQNN